MKPVTIVKLPYDGKTCYQCGCTLVAVLQTSTEKARAFCSQRCYDEWLWDATGAAEDIRPRGV